MAGIRMARLRPMFEAVADVDYGPTTDWKIRYSIEDFKAILKKFIEEYITDTGAWDGPIAGDVTLHYNAAHTGGTTSTDSFVSNDPYDAYKLSGGVGISEATGNTSVSSNFFDPLNPVEGGACPLVDPEDPGGPREDANLTEFAFGSISVLFDLFEPRIPQASWAEATHVWLKFNVSGSASYTYTYVCDPSSGVTGQIAGASISNNVLGIDYSGGGGGFSPAPTSSIPIGDGTTEVFLWSPSGQDFVSLDALDTNNF